MQTPNLSEPMKLSNLFGFIVNVIGGVISSRIMLLAIAIGSLNALGILIFNPLLKPEVLSSFVSDFSLGLLLNVIFSHPILFCLGIVITIGYVFAHIMILHSIDCYIRKQQVDFYESAKVGLYKFFPYILAFLIFLLPNAIFFISLIFSSTSGFNSFYNILIPFFSVIVLIINILFYFQMSLVIVKNVNIFKALIESARLVGFKYFMLIAILNILFIAIGQLSMTIQKTYFSIPAISAMFTFVSGVISIPCISSITLCILYFLISKRNEVKKEIAPSLETVKSLN